MLKDILQKSISIIRHPFVSTDSLYGNVHAARF